MRQLSLILALILTACGTAQTPIATHPPPTETATTAPTSTPTEEATPRPTLTPMDTSDLPAIELLGAFPDTCTNEVAFGDVLGFRVMYYQTTTANFVSAELRDPDGNVIGRVNSSAENRDDEGNWGLYPHAYDLPDNAPITLEIAVHIGEDVESPVSSRTSMTYDCTTGETLNLSFERVSE